MNGIILLQAFFFLLHLTVSLTFSGAKLLLSALNFPEESGLYKAVFLPENRVIDVVKKCAVLINCLYKPAFPAYFQLFHDAPGACIGFQDAGTDTVDVQGQKA